MKMWLVVSILIIISVALHCSADVYITDHNCFKDFNINQEIIYCMSNSDCAFDEFCKKEDGDCDGEGICHTLDFFCNMIILPPVCGCDGVTYYEWGRCAAYWSGVSVDYEGCCDGCCYFLGDFDCNEDVDMYDFSIFASAWLTEPGDARWNPDCDIGIPADNFIGMLDLAVLAENYLKDPL